jgi:hypothetical protein
MESENDFLIVISKERRGEGASKRGRERQTLK